VRDDKHKLLNSLLCSAHMTIVEIVEIVERREEDKIRKNAHLWALQRIL
jgi:hypothetical protein